MLDVSFFFSCLGFVLCGGTICLSCESHIETVLILYRLFWMRAVLLLFVNWNGGCGCGMVIVIAFWRL